MSILSKIGHIEIHKDVLKYTEESIPTDITDDEIDAWLAIIPDLIEFWEAQVAEKKLHLDTEEANYEMAARIAYNTCDERLSVKNKENIAYSDPKVVELAKLVLQKKYELQLTQAVHAKIIAKAQSVHKIASLRARRLESGVVSATIRGDNGCRQKPTRVEKIPGTNEVVVFGKKNDAISKELHNETMRELNSEEVF